MKKRTINSPGAAPAVGAYSQATVAQPGELIFTSGQVALTPEGELVTSSIEDEARQVMINLQNILSAATADFSDVVQVRIYLTDGADFSQVNAVYAEFMPEPYPARECVVVRQLPVPAARVEIGMTAVRTLA